MSQFASNHQKFWAIHRKCQSDPVDIPKTVKQLLTYPQVVQQMIVTHLIYLYSHYASETPTNRWYYPASSSSTLTQAESKRCMFNLRQVVHALAHNDPAPQKHYKVKLNRWQQHLLQHYEVLAPFPDDTTSEAEVFALMWGDEWHKDLEIQKDYNFINLPRLTGYARGFGLSFDEIWFFIRSFQPDRKPLTPIAVNLACRAFVNVSERILRKVGADTEQPPTVELNIYALGGERRGDPYFPDFLETPPEQVRRGQVPTRVAVGDRFPPSGRPISNVDFDTKICTLEHFDNSSYDPRASHRSLKGEPESVRKGRMSYRETPSPPPPPARPIAAIAPVPAVGPLHAAVMGNPSVLESQVVSVVSKKLAELQTRHAALIQQITQQQQEQRAQDVRRMGAELERAERGRQKEMELRAREERLAEREREVEAERERLAAERKKREDGQLAEKEQTGSRPLMDQYLDGQDVSGSDQQQDRFDDYGPDDYQPDAMIDDAEVMSPARSASRPSDPSADARPQVPTLTGWKPAMEPMADVGKGNAPRSGGEKDSDLGNAPVPVTPSRRRPPPVFAFARLAQNASLSSLAPVMGDVDVRASVESIAEEAGAGRKGPGEVDTYVGAGKKDGAPQASALREGAVARAPHASDDVDMNGPEPPAPASDDTNSAAASSEKAEGDDIAPPAGHDNSNNEIAPPLVNDVNESKIAQQPTETSVNVEDKENLPPVATIPAVTGQKRSAEKAEVEEEQSSGDKRARTEDSSADPELASAIEILTAACRAPLVPSTSLNLPTPSASESSIPPFNNLSDAEVGSLRALIGQPMLPASSTPQTEERKGDEDEAAFGRVRVSLENVAEAVREMERGCEVSMRIGRKPDGRFTCSAPEEKMLAGTVDQSSSAADDFSPAQETTLQQKLEETRQEAKRLAEGESLVFQATRKVNGRFLYAIVVE